MAARFSWGEPFPFCTRKSAGMGLASGLYRTKVRPNDAEITCMTPSTATVPQVDAVPDDVSPSYVQTAGSPQETARLCRELLWDIRRAEQEARRLLFESSRVIGTAQAIGTRACQVAHRARDAERAIAQSVAATAQAIRQLRRSGCLSLRERSALDSLPGAERIALTMRHVSEAADRAHQIGRAHV